MYIWIGGSLDVSGGPKELARKRLVANWDPLDQIFRSDLWRHPECDGGDLYCDHQSPMAASKISGSSLNV